MRSTQYTFAKLVVLLALAGTIFVNALANILPFNGKTTGEISGQFPTYFTPAAYVFSIWTVIYLGLIGFALYQALPEKRFLSQTQHHLLSIRWWFVLNCLLNSAWMVLWHYELFGWSVLVMLGILLTLIIIYRHLGIGTNQKIPKKERWLVHLPFSIYLGWITVATIANSSVALTAFEWSGWGIAPQTWAVVMMVVATIVTTVILYQRRDVAYALVIVWALIGIAVRFSDISVLVWSASLCTFVIVLFGFFFMHRHRQ